MLKLKIENFDKLPDGGPLDYAVDRRGFDLGRDSHLDWSLPDKNRVVSGKHCEVRYYDDAYWLVDVSTNGTFVNDSDKRVQSPYLLRDGDRLSIGEYLIAVSVSALPPRQKAPIQFEAMPMPAPPPVQSASVWDTGVQASPPIDPRDLMPPPSPAEQAPAFLNQALHVPDINPSYEQAAVRTPQPVASSAWAVETPRHLPEHHDQPSTGQQAAPPVAPRSTNAASVPAPPVRETAAAESHEWQRSFAKGAGLAPDTFDKLEPQAFAELVGQLVRIASSGLMDMLQSRAEAKALSRGGRTMIRATENNPLKFMPTAEEAMLAILMPRGKGYLGAVETFEKSFTDLKQHHIAILAAMQASANELLNELSPQTLVKSSTAKKSILSNAKAKHWDELEHIWANKTNGRENGILDAFLDEFAKHYEKFGKRKS